MNILTIVLPVVLVILLIIAVIVIVLYKYVYKKRLRRRSKSTSPAPDLLLKNNDRLPMVQMVAKSGSYSLSVPKRPIYDGSNMSPEENVMFRLDLPKGRANTLAPISSRLGDYAKT